MGKLYLGAIVPNEGARRLAAWLNAKSPNVARWAMAAAGLDAMRVDRLLSGELLPGANERYRISIATGHAVLVRDWSAVAAGRWGDPVPVRIMRRAA